MAKAITAILLLTGTQAAGAILILKGKSKITKIRESYSLFWALLFGAMVAFVSQIFKFPGDSATFMLVWTVSSIIITLLFSAQIPPTITCSPDGIIVPFTFKFITTPLF